MGILKVSMPRRWHHLISALLLVVLSGTPALAAVCLGWCDDPIGHAAHVGAASEAATDEGEAAHHGPAHHGSAHHGADDPAATGQVTHAPADTPVAPESTPPCHGAPASDGARLGAALVLACDDALTATEGVSLGATRVDPLATPVAIATTAAGMSPPVVVPHRRAVAGTPADTVFRAPLVLRI